MRANKLFPLNVLVQNRYTPTIETMSHQPPPSGRIIHPIAQLINLSQQLRVLLRQRLVVRRRVLILLLQVLDSGLQLRLLLEVQLVHC